MRYKQYKKRTFRRGLVGVQLTVRVPDHIRTDSVSSMFLRAVTAVVDKTRLGVNGSINYSYINENDDLIQGSHSYEYNWKGDSDV